MNDAERLCVHQVGLLPHGNDQQIHFAYKMYADNTDDGWEKSTHFKKAQCIDVDIDFIGVWDTVSSVGFLRGKELPFTKNNTSVKVFRHALSLDERRAKFPQSSWHWASTDDARLGVQKGEMLKAEEGLDCMDDDTFDVTSEQKKETDVREVWFPGCHSGMCLLCR